MEVAQGMMAELQKQKTENFETLAKTAVDADRYDKHAWNRPPNII